MIYCGSAGSDFGKVSVPVQVLDPDNISTVFQQQKFGKKSCLFNVRSIIFSRKLAFFYFIFLFHFMLDPDSTSA
jgi:hypothetical protein